ncbi:biotin-dependent carboxyltransferase family protein [Rhizobium sp. S152]|uniref:5-oxoprolinase subunit C family protein n=1 Tax=Rhizobium sp. S152 TaxID=3055038 RepID=UPI0025A9FC56|nr:biotin-dependent carboxyltransferase family protein [Rhizobium sp. S152]MDM9625493.1 biotin-dependent carboxyltransferase family protein [Rhizobium sp. S152]
MNTLDIMHAGPMLTVQDLGRSGLLNLGVSGAGPMDRPAMMLANRLAGNEDGAATLEFAHVGGQFTVQQPVRFAVTGGVVDISVDGKPRHGWESHHLLPGQVLKIGALRQSVWGYLAISGGIETPPVLNARSTHLRSGLGGLEGRRLAVGDTLPVGATTPRSLMALRKPIHRPIGPIRVIPGPQMDHFDVATWATFLQEPFKVTASRDRMAQVLDGPVITAARGHDIVSDGTVAGSIQVPSSGRPIVLMAERQTTGGYPKIATVASVDLPRLAQTATGATIRFRSITQDEAEEMLIAQSRDFAATLADLEVKLETPAILEDV